MQLSYIFWVSKRQILLLKPLPFWILVIHVHYDFCVCGSQWLPSPLCALISFAYWVPSGHALCLHVQQKEMQPWGPLRLLIYQLSLLLLILSNPGMYAVLVLSYVPKWMEAKSTLYLEGECFATYLEFLFVLYWHTIAFFFTNMVKMMSFLLRKGVEVNVWDIDQCTKMWSAKPVSFCILHEHILLMQNNISFSDTI